MVKADNTTITKVDDLNGKNVATESNSTAALALKKFAPQANVLLFSEDAQCVAAVQQGRADAYVLDQGILISDAAGAGFAALRQAEHAAKLDTVWIALQGNGHIVAMDGPGDPDVATGDITFIAEVAPSQG